MAEAKVKRDGKLVDADVVEVLGRRERPNNYTLADGTEIVLHTFVTRVVRLRGEYDNNGNPIYQIQSHNAVTIESPEELRESTGEVQ